MGDKTTNTDTLMEKAYAAKERGDNGKAIALYTDAIAAGRNNWVAYFYRGECREKTGDTAGARADYEQAVATDAKYSGQAKEALERLNNKK